MKLSERFVGEIATKLLPIPDIKFRLEFIRKMEVFVEEIAELEEKACLTAAQEFDKYKDVIDKAAKYDDLMEKMPGIIKREIDKVKEDLKMVPQLAALITAALEPVIEKANNWDMLERLPNGYALYHDESIPAESKWDILKMKLGGGEIEDHVQDGMTPAEALHKYWESKK